MTVFTGKCETCNVTVVFGDDKLKWMNPSEQPYIICPRCGVKIYVNEANQAG